MAPAALFWCPGPAIHTICFLRQAQLITSYKTRVLYKPGAYMDNGPKELKSPGTTPVATQQSSPLVRR